MCVSTVEKTCSRCIRMCILIVVVLFVMLLPRRSFALQSGAFIYQETTNNTVTITGHVGMDSNLVIPSMIDSKNVTSIGDYAFNLHYNLRSVSLPSGVTNIGNAAFWECLFLTSITIPDSVTSIGNGAFADCSNLTGVIIPDSVSYIGDEAFRCCSSVTILVDANNPNYSSSDGVLYNKNQTTLIQYAGGAAGPYSIPNTVTRIEDFAFEACPNLTSVTIPDSVTSIGWEVGFSSCSSLASILVDTNNPNYSSSDGVLYNKNQTTLLQYAGGAVGSYSIPNTVTNIGNYAFQDCTSLTGVSIPDTVISIGAIAFWGCDNLESVIIPDSIAIIPQGAFVSCDSLTTVAIPNSVTNIKGSAFWLCDNLTSVTIGDAVITIGDNAFRSCPSMTDAYFLGDAPSPGSNLFYDSAIQIVYYKAGALGWGATYAGVPTMACTATTAQMIPHNWLLTNFPGLVSDNDYETAALDDQDNDGMSTWEEFVAGTSPTNGSSLFEVKTVSADSNVTDTVISWQSVTGRLYSVYSHTNLSVAWPTTTVYQVQGDATQMTYTNTEPVTPIFFRLSVELHP